MAMSGTEGQNSLQGKGWCFMILIGFFLLFFITWIYVISGNNNALIPAK